MNHQITIQNLKCGGCAHTIKTELEKIDGVTKVSVDEENDVVSFDSSEPLVEKVAERLSELGYPAEGDANNILKKAKSFVSCAAGRINKD